MLSDAQALGDVGMATAADLAAARERVASAAVQRIRARATADNAVATLRSLMRVESGELELADSLGGPLPPLPDSVQTLQRLALGSRPELGAAQALQKALTAGRTAAAAGSWPDVLAIAQWDYNRPNQRYFPTSEEWHDSWSVGVVGSWTVFDGGKARAEARSLEAAAMAASRDVAELERSVLLEVDTARNDLASMLGAVTAADAALEAASEREREVRQHHAAGVASTADLLDAEAQLSASERLVIETRSNAWIAAARLDRAVGR
jgi:outer membrane protein TolC